MYVVFGLNDFGLNGSMVRFSKSFKISKQFEFDTFEPSRTIVKLLVASDSYNVCLV